jgi:hypothetical protein
MGFSLRRDAPSSTLPTSLFCKHSIAFVSAFVYAVCLEDECLFLDLHSFIRFDL